jgi:hypothetical protein
MILAAFALLFASRVYFAGVEVLAGALGADGVDAGALADEDESEDDVLAGVLELSPDELLLSPPELDFAAALLP